MRQTNFWCGFQLTVDSSLSVALYFILYALQRTQVREMNVHGRLFIIRVVKSLWSIVVTEKSFVSLKGRHNNCLTRSRAPSAHITTISNSAHSSILLLTIRLWNFLLWIRLISKVYASNTSTDELDCALLGNCWGVFSQPEQSPTLSFALLSVWIGGNLMITYIYILYERLS